mmetsp:Transcript_118384/g.295378  ORF Transcript_118384/g.295378 Transcript_118384/m.295378 type:complete len:154 (-) Transcript_118384:178-639(-)
MRGSQQQSVVVVGSRRSSESSGSGGGYPRDTTRSTASSTYDFAHIPGYSGHQPATSRNSGKMGKTFNNAVRPDRFKTEAGKVGVGAMQAPEIRASGIPYHQWESTRVLEHERPFRHHESYAGHIPQSPKNVSHYGKTFGTELNEWKHLTPRPW